MKYEIKLLAAMLMVIAITAVLTTAATSDKTDDKQPDWVIGNPWFGWYPERAYIGQPVQWSGGVRGFGSHFHALVQINRPSEIRIPSWSYTISMQGVCEPCRVVRTVVYMDGQWWWTWHTWNPERNGLYCFCFPATSFFIEVSGEAIPSACGQFIGRSQGGVSGFFFMASRTLRVC
jgi:hypothetical protein